MNLYSSKQRWKIILILIAVIIVGASLWYSNIIVNDIRREEQEKVKVWSAAIRKKAQDYLVDQQLFDRLKEEERFRSNLWARALRKIATGSTGTDDDFTFFLDIVQANRDVPVILVTKNGEHITDQNLNFSIDALRDSIRSDYANQPDSVWRHVYEQALQDSVSKYISEWGKSNPPIQVDIDESEAQYLYYTESRLFQRLQHHRDSLIVSFTNEVENSVSVPAIFTNQRRDSIIASSIPEIPTGKVTYENRKYIAMMETANPPIKITIDAKRSGLIFYEDSAVLTQLKYYPVVMFSIIGLFLIIAYILFSMFRRAEQNQVWVGLAKETAHQLGTPLSSLMAWMELLEAQGVDEATLTELNKDVKRLEIITDRFSKIGAETELTPHHVAEVVQGVVDYLQVRVSRKVQISITEHSKEKAMGLLNKPLFEWVIENLTKNAIDAMKGDGNIDFSILKMDNNVIIDVHDSGSGIHPSKFKTVFQPGYTTKKRGWGLGLSLVKRIVDEYHHGKIFVKSSDLDKGTTFRIVIKQEKD